MDGNRPSVNTRSLFDEHQAPRRVSNDAPGARSPTPVCRPDKRALLWNSKVTGNSRVSGMGQPTPTANFFEWPARSIAAAGRVA